MSDSRPVRNLLVGSKSLAVKVMLWTSWARLAAAALAALAAMMAFCAAMAGSGEEWRGFPWPLGLGKMEVLSFIFVRPKFGSVHSYGEWNLSLIHI